MNCTKIGLGIAAWFLGILVPVMHHILLHWPIAGNQTDNIVTRSQSIFKYLPWMDSVYLYAMAVVGLLLILSGFKADKTPKPS